jgi:hypothetical protein
LNFILLPAVSDNSVHSYPFMGGFKGRMISKIILRAV